MTSVTNEYRIKYNLNTKSKKSAGDGDSYQIEGQPNRWVKLLKDNSKNKELEIRQQIEFGGGYGAPQEVVYSGRGKFAGYVYEMEEAEPEPIPDWTPTQTQTTIPVKSDFTQTGWFKIGGSVLLAVILAFLNVNVFYPMYRGILIRNFSEQATSMCSALSFSGVTGIIGGIVLMFLFAKHFMSKSDGAIFVIFEGLSFLAGILLVDTVIVLLILIILGAVSLVLAIMPLVIGVCAVIYVIKLVFKK